MVFSSLIFLYAFFSISLLVYWLCPTQKAKNTSLLIFSLVFYAWGEPKYVFLLIVNVIFLIAGCFVDANSAMYIFIPIMYPVAMKLGIDLIHFGIIATVSLAIGQVTPPVGVNLFVASGLKLPGRPQVTITEMSKKVWVQVVACIIVLLLVTYIPAISLFILGK